MHGAATITATLDADRYEVLHAESTKGHCLTVTPDDLDESPFVVTRSYEVCETTVLDVMTGLAVRFTVCHDRGEILEVRYDDGRRAARQHEQFTEVAEAFAIDRRFGWKASTTASLCCDRTGERGNQAIRSGPWLPHPHLKTNRRSPCYAPSTRPSHWSAT